MAELAARAEERGWDGFFVWDHVAYREPVRARGGPVGDARGRRDGHRAACHRPAGHAARRAAGRTSSRARRSRWTASAAAGWCWASASAASAPASSTRPLRRGAATRGRARAARRRARAAAGLLGRRVRAPAGAAAADPGLGGGPLAEPAPAGARGALGRPVPDRPAGPRGARRAGRGGRGPARARRAGAFDLVVTNPPGTDPAPWVEAGATWCLTGFGPQPTVDEVREAIDARG